MDTQLFIDQLAREAGAAYNTAAEAATEALKREQEALPSKEELVSKCVCEQRSNSGDPCTESGLDEAQEKKMRADIDSSCAQELHQMPGAMKQQIKNECIKRRTESAGMEFKDPEEEEAKEAARKHIQETCAKKVEQSLKPKVIRVIEDAELVILKCMCAKTTCRTDEEQLEIEEAEEETTKTCKKQVAMEVAEAMGEGGDAWTTEQMAEKIESCVCEAREDGPNPCMTIDDWEAKKEELRAVQASCRKPLHDEL
jgi:hypothetical protein